MLLQESPQPKSIQLNIDTIGLSSARYQSALFQTDLNRIIVPVSCSLTVWDVQKNQRTHFLQVHNNSIFSLHENQKYIYSLAYNGEIAVLDRINITIIKTINKYKLIKLNNLKECWKNKQTCLSEESQNKQGAIHIYDLELRSEPILIYGPFSYCQLNNQNELIVLKEQKMKIENKEKLSLKEKQKLKNTRKYKLSLTIYDVPTQAIIREIDLGIIGNFTCGSSSQNDFLGLILQDRNIIIYDLNNHTYNVFENIKGSGVIQSCCFYNKVFIFYSRSGELGRIINNQVTYQGGFKNNIFNVCPQYINQYKDNGYFLITDFGITISDNDSIVFQQLFGNITFCGLSSKNQSVFAGDFCGMVRAFDTKSGEYFFKIDIGLPIRALDVFVNLPIVVFGTIEGSLYFANYEEDHEPSFIEHLDSCITCIRTNEFDGKYYILTVNGMGYYFIFQKIENKFELILRYQAHLPQKDADKEKFGSLSNFAECWSTAFHPDKPDILATCSEDQTVHVYENSLKEPKQIQLLKGHKLAVTCLDWKHTKLGTLLVSSSDDQTVRIYNTDQGFTLMKTITTSFIKEWHTLTYIALKETNQNDKLLSIGSQNGYYFIYDLEEDKFIYADKIHMGGIEGLVWRNQQISTCSSDNTINLIKL